jgi:hypothetical protein
MSANDDPHFLFVGELANGNKKLYIGKGVFHENREYGWQHIKPQDNKPSTKNRILGGTNDSEDKIREAAATQARLLFDSPEDLSNKDKTYKSWDTGRARWLKTGFPNPLFSFNPWQNAPALETEASVDKSTQQSSGDTSFSFAKYLAVLRPEQKAFRQAVFARYGTKCAFCSITVAELLHASHIRDFAVDRTSNTADNGIPLCLNHHGAFDVHYIKIDADSLAVTVHHTMIANTVNVRSLAGYLPEAAKPYLRHRMADSVVQ